jgi:SNW domain-containing protein 1
VQFEKDTAVQPDADPFNIDEMIRESTAGMGVNGSKRYGVQEPEGRASKRARVEEDDG